MKKFRRTLAITIIAGLLIATGVYYFLQSNTKNAKAAWYNASWTYRQPITITNNGSLQTNYILEVTADTKTLIDATKLQSDCDDIRFTTADGSTLIDYFTDFCSNTTGVNSSFFVEVPSIAASGTTTIYLYYGNSGASAVSSFSSIGSTTPPGIWLGTGRDGAISITADTNINTADSIGSRACSDTTGGDAVIYTSNDNIAAADTTIDLATSPSNPSCLTAGDEVLILNAKGTSAATGDGLYEFARISSISTNVITLNRPLINAYNGTNREVVVQRVPNYTNVTLTNSGTDFVPSAWDGVTNMRGGVMAFRSNGTVSLASGTTINANALGYAGGAAGASGANGGGGGESYMGSAGNGQSGNGSAPTGGGGESGNGTNASPNNGIVTGGGGGGGSSGSATGTNAAGGGGGGAYGFGGGGGGGGSDGSSSDAGSGGAAGSTSANGGGGGGGTNGNTAGGNGGAAGSAGATATSGVGGQVGSGTTGGSGGGGGNATTAAGAGGGGGGSYGTAALTTLYFGSGGGGGGGSIVTPTVGTAGAAGGGIVYFQTATLSNTGTISSNGGAGNAGGAQYRGGGGAGAGGSVLIGTINDTAGTVTATGGAAASDTGTDLAGAGAGGHGRVHLKYTDTSAPTSTPTANTAQSPTISLGSEIDYTTYNNTLVTTVRYGFDEGSGSSTDGSGSNNSVLATISGATWESEEYCVYDKCLYFDGTNDVVTITNPIDESRTVSFWVRPMTTTEQLIDMNGTASISVASGTISATGFTSPTIYVNGRVSSTLEANRWQHVVVTTSTAVSTSAFKVAQISTNYGQGFFDDIQLFDQAFTADQVRGLYNGQGDNGGANVAIGGGSTGAPNNRMLSDGLVGYWKMDESSGNRTDSSGNNFTLTDTNTVGSTTSGKYHYAGDFIPANNEYLERAHSAGNALDINGSLTLAAWVYVDTVQAYGGIINKADDNTAANNQYYLGFDAEGDNLRFGINNGASESQLLGTSDFDNLLGQWVFVAATFDSASRQMRIYRNGVEDATPTTATSSTITTTDSVFRLGRQFADWDLDGRIDEARVYNRALTPSEIKTLYEWAPGPIVHWKLDENTGTTAADSSSNGINLTGTGTFRWFQSIFNSGILVLGGTNNYLSYTDPGTSIVDIPGSYTISTWVRLNVLNIDFQTFVFKSVDNTDFNENYYLGTYYDAGGGNNYRDELACEHAYANNVYETVFTTSFNLQTNRWYYVTCVYNTITNTQQILVDGVLQATNSAADNDPMIIDGGDSTGDLYLGGVSTAISFAPASVNGTLDNVQIYNYPRTTKHIIQDMNAGHPLVGTPIGGPIGHWRFDEGYGTTANNIGTLSTTANGTLTNMASPATSSSGWTLNGRFNKSLIFDGSNDYVTIPDNNAFSPSTTEPITLSAWFNADSLTSSTRNYIVSKGNASNYEWAMGSYGATDLYCEGWQADGTGHLGAGGFESYVTGITVTTGEWHHIACVIQPGNRLDLYYDGKLRYSDTTSSGSMSNGTATVEIGRRADNGDAEFDGRIDEVKIYRAALSASDIQTEFNQGKSLVLGATGTTSSNLPDNSATRTYCIPGDTNTCTAPIGEWNLDDNTGTTANDTSSNGLSGTLSGGARWTNGKVGTAVQFDGTDDYISVSDNAVFDLTSSITLQAWTKYLGSTFNSDDTLLGRGKSSSNNWHYYFSKINGTDVFNFNVENSSGTAANVESGTISSNRWYHLTGTWDGTNVRIFVDGILAASDTLSGSFSNTANPFVIGSAESFSNPAGFPYEGLVDQVKLFNYARTPSQIAWDFNKGAPVAWWKFDETSGTTAYDSSLDGNGDSNGSSGTLNNTPTRLTTAKVNGGIDFDGTDDTVTVTNNNRIDFNNALDQEFSFAYWVYPQSDGENDLGQIFEKNANTCYTFGQTGSTVSIDCYIDLDTNGAETSVSGIPLNQWSHIAVTWKDDADDEINMYVNGILRSTSTGGDGGTTNDINATLTIGGGTDNYDGYLDEFKIFNFELTPAQVEIVANEGSAVKF